MTYDNNNSAVLFKNDRKEKDNHPDYNGNAEVDGKEYWLNAWVKESSKTGKKFFSLSFTPKEPKEAVQGGTIQTSGANIQTKDDTDQEIPF